MYSLPTPNPLAVVLLLGLLAFSRFYLYQRKTSLPPGPRGWPIIGNLLDVPLMHPWKVYDRWAKQYDSGILSLRIPGATLIILNDLNIVQDLFSKRALIYSDRAHPSVLNMMDVSRLFVFQDYGEKWKHYRMVFKHQFEANKDVPSRIHELAATRRLLGRLVKAENHEKELRLTAADAILSITYGIQAGWSGSIRKMRNVEPLNLVDALPLLNMLPSWFPGAQFKEKATRGKKLVDQVLQTPFEYVKAEVAKGTAVSSVASLFLASLEDVDSASQKELDDFQNILGTAYLGGADTTVSQLCSFTLAMLLYPNVQRKAQAILDSTINGRLPNFTDYGKIPYIDAIVNEILRWNPMTPLGVFHVLNRDDTYKGYTLPKGAICMPNIWAILHDEQRYGPHVNEFIPERFLTEDGGKMNPDISDVDAAFGFGRRVCPGRGRGLVLVFSEYVD
ncbi:cytochrome P450 [Gymnopus androsaceus JB14]|uniref:Cytochrome P450 n=1 Tax=Gymnopus androsaceus JB14 TaxID=1447944 RepID=A0A6A4GMP8_9AGAR|nr:cytochrome P450 [Gymnopus androsaceus JB14]